MIAAYLHVHRLYICTCTQHANTCMHVLISVCVCVCASRRDRVCIYRCSRQRMSQTNEVNAHINAQSTHTHVTALGRSLFASGAQSARRATPVDSCTYMYAYFHANMHASCLLHCYVWLCVRVNAKCTGLRWVAVYN